MESQVDDATPDDFVNAIGSSPADHTVSVSENGEILAESTGEQMVGPFAFCVTFNDRQVGTLKLFAPSAEAAAATLAAMLNAANQTNPGWAAFVGACAPRG
jgi:hypothetical protein